MELVRFLRLISGKAKASVPGKTSAGNMFSTPRADEARRGQARHRGMVRLRGPDSGKPATDGQATHTHQSPSDGKDKSADRGPHRGHIPAGPGALSVRHYLQFPLFNWGPERGNSSSRKTSKSTCGRDGPGELIHEPAASGPKTITTTRLFS